MDQNKPLKIDKNKLWNELGLELTNSHAQKVNEYMDLLLAENRMEEFMDYYFKLLQYFKPKIQAHAIRQQTEIIFRFAQDDKELLDKV